MMDPNWSNNWTASEAEAQLKDFKFLGPGWYTMGASTLLVLPLERSQSRLWSGIIKPEEKFQFRMYEVRNPRLALQAILQAPRYT